MAKRRRRARLKRFLRRHRGLTAVLCVLVVLYLSYSLFISHLEHSVTASPQIAEQKPPVELDLLEDPRAYLAAERAQAIAELEPLFIGLFVLIPASFVLVGVICVVRTLQKAPAWETSRTLSAEQQRRADAFRHEIVKRSRR